MVCRGTDAHGFDCVGKDELGEVEVGSLADMCVEIFGEEIPYRRGVLSGWRMTSLVETMEQ